MIVVGIIGLIAALVMPAMKGFREGNTMQTANRQLTDDLAFARAKAISERTTVYVVFIPPGIQQLVVTNGWTPKEMKQYDALLQGQYNTYALFTKRKVGAQPGRDEPRFLSTWKNLPEGIFFAPPKFMTNLPSNSPYFGRPFSYVSLPFPSASSRPVRLPAVAFNYLGQLRNLATNSLDVFRDELIPLTRGSVMYSGASPDLQESPAGNWTNNYNALRINWLTGRVKIEHATFE